MSNNQFNPNPNPYPGYPQQMQGFNPMNPSMPSFNGQPFQPTNSQFPPSTQPYIPQNMMYTTSPQMHYVEEQSQPNPPTFDMNEFPSLDALKSGGQSSQSSSSSSSSSGQPKKKSSNRQQQQQPSSSSQLPPPHQSTPQKNRAPSSQPPPLNGSSPSPSKLMAQRATHREVNPSEEAFFGLQGLVDLIQHRKRDVSTLRLGIDLGSLGLDLNSSEPLHRSMKSPFTSRDRASSSSSGGKSSKEEEEEEDSFSLPACYSFKPPRLQLEHFGSFPIQTLLYVFYSLPQETIQAIAAQELYRRGLKYHDRLRAWFTRKEVKNTFQIFKFDVEDWQMKPFPIGSEQEERKLVEGFLSEDDVRVRMPPPPTSQQQPQQPQQQPSQQPSQPNTSSGSSTGK